MAVATGNWGCGAFGGDCYLKVLLQLMAAAMCKRDVVYLTFGDEKLAKDISLIHQLLIEQDLDAGVCYCVIIERSYIKTRQRDKCFKVLNCMIIYIYIFL